jgi:hypothetical protein
MSKKKLILTDADGVLVNWLSGFEKFMSERGYPREPNSEHEYLIPKRHKNVPEEVVHSLLREFADSEHIAHLDAYADSVKYVKLLSEQGFRFVVITALSDSPMATLNRMRNLHTHFGNVFDDIQCIRMGAMKTEFLRPWEGSGYFWIEDHPKQAQTGHDLGLKPILIDYPHNAEHEVVFPRVSNHAPWEEIYEIIMKDY